MCCTSRAVSIGFGYDGVYRVVNASVPAVVIDHSQAIRFAVDIARGMSYLHSLDPAILRCAPLCAPYIA